MGYALRKFLKKTALIVAISLAYGLFLWRGSDQSPWLLASNMLSLPGMVFFILGLCGLVHNTHALAAFTYSFRYVANMVRNVRNNDAATDTKVPAYHEYVTAREQRDHVSWDFIAAAVFIGACLLVWKIGC